MVLWLKRRSTMLDLIEKITSQAPPNKTNLFEKMAKSFYNKEPDSIYYDYDELSRMTVILPQHEAYTTSPKDWEIFLDIPEIKQYIKVKLSKYSDVQARKALKQLTRTDLAPADLNALKEIINKASFMKENQSNNRTVIMSYIPPIDYETTKEGESDSNDELET
jgi:hypothetical protein